MLYPFTPSFFLQVYFWWKRRQFYRSNDNSKYTSDEIASSPIINGPKPLILVGNALPLLFEGPHTLLTKLSCTYGGLFLFFLGTCPYVIINDANLAKTVLNLSTTSFKKGYFANIMRPLVGNGLLTSEGETWKIHHRLAVSTFQVIYI
jgi:hypothetical protein